MDFQQVIEARRSVRKFRDEEVPHEVLAQAIEAALHAPSSRNSRSTRFLAVRDAATVHRMAAMRDYGAVPLAGAPAAVVVMGDRAASDLWVDNAAIAATILQLALVDAGLKSCWVHVNGRPRSKEQPDGEQAVDYLRTFLPIPEGCGVLCVIALGYSDFEPKPLSAGEPVERVQWVE
ncbi:nitroreductase family protein [Alistipes communis]|uniref:nitroreductase family protein n=1 Tax=Alistipes communis TaxID=2585118 RepID=UPI00242AA97B|nr:nitroreductase family protein [Alistipes communis]